MKTTLKIDESRKETWVLWHLRWGNRLEITRKIARNLEKIVLDT